MIEKKGGFYEIASSCCTLRIKEEKGEGGGGRGKRGINKPVRACVKQEKPDNAN
jgi:hypothetical protein